MRYGADIIRYSIKKGRKISNPLVITIVSKSLGIIIITRINIGFYKGAIVETYPPGTLK